MAEIIPEPFRIKVVEPIHLIDREAREQALQKAGYNVFNIPSEHVFIDLLTDSGTGAMSDNQWAGLHLGDEAYACCRNWFHFEHQIQALTGLQYVIPTHQGRVAENLLFSVVCRPGTMIPSNNHFDTTRANIMANEGEPLDLVIAEGRDPQSLYPFKGNIDLGRLDAVLKTHGAPKIPLAMLTLTNNSGGGQPVSMQNIKAVKEMLKPYQIPLFFDACRFAENAYFIKVRESGYSHRSIESIVHEMFSYADGCTMSAKKDGLVNMGGFLALNDARLAEKVKAKLILIEGFLTYGGLAGRDLEAIARGLAEVLDENYLTYRIAQVKYLADLLDEYGVPCLKPTGGHAVYLDARRFLPRIPPAHFPGQTIVTQLYLEAGVRSVEVGSFMFAHPGPDGHMVHPDMELVRLAIPRRVYTHAQLAYVAHAVHELYQKRDRLSGMRIISGGEGSLRHFTAHLEYLSKS